MTAATVWVCLYLILRSFRKPGRDVQDESYLHIFISFHAIIFRKSRGRSEPTRRDNRIERETAIQGHAFWDHWKADDGLRIAI